MKKIERKRDDSNGKFGQCPVSSVESPVTSVMIRYLVLVTRDSRTGTVPASSDSKLEIRDS